jgi:hypothetical protein
MRRLQVRRATLALVLAALCVFAGCAGELRPTNVVLIVLDTLRADRLSAYGNPRQTSPVLDDLASRGVLFETVVSNSSWTLPAVAGLLSGRHLTKDVLDEGLKYSLVERLRDAGVTTVAFTEGGRGPPSCLCTPTRHVFRTCVRRLPREWIGAGYPNGTVSSRQPCGESKS